MFPDSGDLRRGEGSIDDHPDYLGSPDSENSRVVADSHAPRSPRPTGGPQLPRRSNGLSFWLSFSWPEMSLCRLTVVPCVVPLPSARASPVTSVRHSVADPLATPIGSLLRRKHSTAKSADTFAKYVF